MRRSRLGWAGLLSVLLHVAILALLWEQEPVRPVSAPPRACSASGEQSSARLPGRAAWLLSDQEEARKEAPVGTSEEAPHRFPRSSFTPLKGIRE
jgi:hypothetical protein